MSGDFDGSILFCLVKRLRLVDELEDPQRPSAWRVDGYDQDRSHLAPNVRDVGPRRLEYRRAARAQPLFVHHGVEYLTNVQLWPRVHSRLLRTARHQLQLPEAVLVKQDVLRCEHSLRSVHQAREHVLFVSRNERQLGREVGAGSLANELAELGIADPAVAVIVGIHDELLGGYVRAPPRAT